MKKFLAALIIAGNMLLTATVNAEIQTYTGVGEYLMSDFETFDVAQQRAKQRAEQNACEQAGVYVESRTEVQNAQVTRDEIITMTSGILKVTDVQFKREIVDDTKTKIRATVTANIDSDDINKWLAKDAQERAALVAQNEALRQSVAEQDKQIAALKQQLDDVRTAQDKERVTQQFAEEDRIFLSNRKYEEGGRLLMSKDFTGAINSFTQAIELDPNNFKAYYVRGGCYGYFLKDYPRAIEDFDRAIELRPGNSWAYLQRGFFYQALKDYWQSIADFSRAIRLDPTQATAFIGRGNGYAGLGDYDRANADWDTARRLGYNDRKNFYE